MTIQHEFKQLAFHVAKFIAPSETSTKDWLKKYMKSMCERFSRNEQEESFYVADLGEIYRQHRRWERNLEQVKPFYGMCKHFQPLSRATT